MNRRAFLTAAGGALATLGAGGVVAHRIRLDVAAEPAMSRAAGEPIAVDRTINDESVELVTGTDDVRWPALESGDEVVSYRVEPLEQWARRRCASIGSTVVLSEIRNRIEGRVEGVGTGVRSLVFGLVITVDHTVTRNPDGDVTSRPNVDLGNLVAVAPRSVETTIRFEGRTFTRDVPIAVTHVETQYL